MTTNKLHIAEVSQKCPGFPSQKPRDSRRLEIQAQMERAWLQNPEEFNPQRDCIQRQRVERTLAAVSSCTNMQGKKGVDLGCGSGFVTRKLRDLGAASFDAVDVAAQALKLLQEGGIENIRPIQDCLPMTRLVDSNYDVVMCTEVIGYLQQDEYRLLFAELSRVVNFNGIVVCSTALDSSTEHPLDIFSQLADSEFEPLSWVLSYHRPFIKLCLLCEYPGKQLKIAQDPQQKHKILDDKKGIGYYWHTMLLSKPFQGLWWLLNIVAGPLGKKFRQSDKTRDFFEKISKFFSGPEGASHAIFVGKRRPLTFPLPPNEIPRERKEKRHVWE